MVTLEVRLFARQNPVFPVKISGMYGAPYRGVKGVPVKESIQYTATSKDFGVGSYTRCLKERILSLFCKH